MSLKDATPEPVVELLHGQTVVDPYRWLEDRDSPATGAWIARQHEQHDAYFSRIAESDWLRDHVSDLLNVETLDQPTKVGHRYFYRRRKKNQEQACICMRDAMTGVERVL